MPETTKTVDTPENKETATAPTKAPARKKTTASKPAAAKKPAVNKPVAKKTTASKPAAKKPAAKSVDTSKELKELQKEFDAFKRQAEKAAEKQAKVLEAYPLDIVPFNSLQIVYKNNRRGGKAVVTALHDPVFEASVKNSGTIEPLIVQKDKNGNLKVLNGYRRSYANQVILSKGEMPKQPKGYEDEKILYVPVRILPPDMPLTDIIALENGANMHKPWTGPALVKAAKELRDAGHTNKEIGTALSINEKQVGGYVHVAENKVALKKLQDQTSIDYADLPIKLTELVSLTQTINMVKDKEGLTPEEVEKKTEEILGTVQEQAQKAGKRTINREVVNKVKAELKGTPKPTQEDQKPETPEPTKPKAFDFSLFLTQVYNMTMEKFEGTPEAVFVETLYDTYTQAVHKGTVAEIAANNAFSAIEVVINARTAGDQEAETEEL